MKTLDPETMTLAEKLKLIYRHTHRDYKSTKTKSILVLRAGGTSLVPITDLTAEEVADKLSYALHAENKKRTAPAWWSFGTEGMKNGSGYRVASRGMFAHYINGDYMGMLTELPFYKNELHPFTKEEAAPLLPSNMGGNVYFTL